MQITKKDVFAALDEIDGDKVPARRRARKYCLKERNRHYPPKYVVGLAWKHATGRERLAKDFSAGKSGANATLEALASEWNSVNRHRWITSADGRLSMKLPFQFGDSGNGSPG